MPLLFSYGTLQQESVQLVRTSGKTHHPIVRFTGAADALVPGKAFEIADEEPEQADRYEVSAYRRVSARLLSGREAWVYIDARSAPAASTKTAD